MSNQPSPASPIDPKEFRNCCGRFATGITIITTEVDGQVHGMTANGFMSVSLEPPLVLVSIGNDTRMFDFLKQSQTYGISVLGDDLLAISNQFAGSPDDSLEIPWVRVNDVPLIDGALANMTADVVDMHPAGDHTLFIAEVNFLSYIEGNPLLFYGGRYRYLQ